MASTDESSINTARAAETNLEKENEVEPDLQELNKHKIIEEESILNEVEKVDAIKEVSDVTDNEESTVNGDTNNFDGEVEKKASLTSDTINNLNLVNDSTEEKSADATNSNKDVIIKQTSEVELAKGDPENDEKSSALEWNIQDVQTKDDEQVTEKGDGENFRKVSVEDESDGEIVDSDDGEEVKKESIAVDFGGLDDVVRHELDQLDYDEDVDDGEIKDEPEDKKAAAESKEMSDGEIASSDEEVKSDSENKGQNPSNRLRNDDYEEGEMIDGAEKPQLPRETCRFFERGNCTWGDRCRFIHPGINDRGSYKMFDDERRRPPFLGPPPMRFPPPLDPRGHPIPPPFPPAMMFGPPPPETAWERGLRHAKEMRRRSMQRKVEEPDFMRKREVLSLNEALNVDRDLDYIAQKPLADEESRGDPFITLEEDERFAVPSLEDVKKMKRHGKNHSRSDGRSNDGSRRQLSPRSAHVRREVDDRGRDRRSPPRHPGMGGPHSHDRHQPPPMSHHMSHMHHDYRDRGGRHERDYRDRRMPDMKERDYRMDQSRNYPHEDEYSPRKGGPESRVVAVDSSGKRKSGHSGRGEVWSDPWARGRQNVKKRQSRSNSESSGSTSSSSGSSFSSRSGSDSSRSSSRSSYSSSDSSSASSRSPSPQKTTKKVVKVKKATAPKTTASKAKNLPPASKPSAALTKSTVAGKKAAELARAKLTKPLLSKPGQKVANPPIIKQSAKGQAAPRGRPPVKIAPKKKGKQKTYDSSSSSEFSHSSSSESRSRSRSEDKGSDSFSESGSSSGSSSDSDSYSSSSGSSSGSSDEEVSKKPKPVKKVASVKSVAPPPGEKKPIGKMAGVAKVGSKNPRMNVAEKTAAAKPPAPIESRKRSASAMNVPAKKGAAIANRRSELLEQLKVVENAIMKKRAKLT